MRVIQTRVSDEVYSLHQELVELLNKEGLLYKTWLANAEAQEFNRRLLAGRRKIKRQKEAERGKEQ